MSFHIYLASASPRRRELLEQIGVTYRRLSVDLDESLLAGEGPEMHVLRLAIAKARAGREQLAADDIHPVLGADTVVVAEGQILGKPRDRAEGLAMLQRLAGRSHHVLTAVALVEAEGETHSRLSSSVVTFRPMSESEVGAYWASGEPADKAGAYGIQGKAAIFVQRIEGSYSGVMGLPLFELAELLKECRIPVPGAWGHEGTP